jgi:CRISPR-associated protein (TIGR03986 family)
MSQKQDGVWEIIPAKEYRANDEPKTSAVTFFRIEREHIPKSLKHWHNCANSWTIYFKPEPVKNHAHNQGQVTLRYAKVEHAAGQPGKDLVEGVVVVTGKIPRKHMEFVFNMPDMAAKRISVSEDIIASYREQITKEQEEIVGKIEDDKIKTDENAALKNMQPVFYLLDKKGDLVFFGHAMMFRLPYLNSPQDFVPEALRDTDERAKYDLAEALFGYVKKSGSSKERAYASRIAITDATLVPNQDNKNIWLGEETNNHVVVPSILAGPKPSTFQHYLVQTNPDDKRALYHWASKTPLETIIRGHKLYWHKGNISLRQLAAFPAPHPTSTQHTQMKPVRSGVRFLFRIYFDNLSDVELGALLWALNLPGEAGHEYRHKIGMGKPLGMGAVKILTVLRLIDRKLRYRQLFDEQNWFVGTREASNSIEPLIKEFESFILAAIGAKGVERLSQVDRIRMLLKMHEWPGPDSKWTRYMEIERLAPGEKGGKLNEYKDRPVLPHPLNMGRQSVFVTGEQERLRKNVSARPQPAKLRAKAVPPKPISEKAKSPVPELPAPVELLQELKKQKSETGATPAGRPLRRGDKVKAEVLNKLGTKVTVRLQDSTGTEVSFEQPYYPYRPGENVRVKVVAIDEKTGRITKVLPA